jgi:hypothetical protein
MNQILRRIESIQYLFCREQLIRGTEVSTFVLITNFIQSSDVLKYFSRSTSSLIVVCEEESANRIVADEDSTFSNTIAIKGIMQRNVLFFDCQSSPLNLFHLPLTLSTSVC